MRKYTLALLLPLLVCMVAFKSAAPGAGKILLKKVTNLKTGSYSTYQYDNEGRVTTMLGSTGARIKYYYTGNRAIKEFYPVPGKEPQVDTFELNEAGFAAKQWQPGVVGLYSEMEKDKDGHLLAQRTIHKGAVISSTKNEYRSGNQVSFKAYNEKGKMDNEVYWTYYPDKLNTIGNECKGLGFMGSGSKNLVRTYIAILLPGDTTRLTPRYEFDAQGRVTLEVNLLSDGRCADSTAYEYW